jgi:hypothetical protein
MKEKWQSKAKIPKLLSFLNARERTRGQLPAQEEEIKALSFRWRVGEIEVENNQRSQRA